MNYSLFLDTTSNKINLAIINEQNIIVDTFVRNTNQDMIEHIINDIKHLIDKNQINIENIKKIYCIDNLGLFTGIRTSSLIIKAWTTFNKKMKIYHMHPLAYVASGKCISLMDAKSNQYYCAIYNNRKEIKKPFLIHHNDLTSIKNEYINYQVILCNEINLNHIVSKLKYFKKVKIKKYKINYLKAPC